MNRKNCTQKINGIYVFLLVIYYWKVLNKWCKCVNCINFLCTIFLAEMYTTDKPNKKILIPQCSVMIYFRANFFLKYMHDFTKNLPSVVNSLLIIQLSFQLYKMPNHMPKWNFFEVVDSVILKFLAVLKFPDDDLYFPAVVFLF